MSASSAGPLSAFFDSQGCIVLDGGLATELEARGHDLDDPLWSAKVLLEDPDAVRDVHTRYLEAGADCIATITYQATLQGFEARGFDRSQASARLREAVELAVAARDTFWADAEHRIGRVRPIVAASVGPYGAFLADGSEYSGAYGLTRGQLADFHRDRWELLASAGADILACETIPSAVEARALLSLLDETRDSTWAWISFSCPDGDHISDGTPITEVARLCDGATHLAAIGINCTDPRHVKSLVQAIRCVSALPILVYPNSGELYDIGSRSWVGSAPESPWADAPLHWLAAGANGVGGCCRVGPEDVSAIRSVLLG